MMASGTLTTQKILIEINAFGSSKITLLTQIDLPELLVSIRAPKIRYRSVSVSLAPISIWSDLQNGCTQTSGHEETKKAVGIC